MASRTLRELVGQEHVTRTLGEALKRGRIAHAFLFTGIRGVGKTTAARILARCLNCEKGPTPEPCGECAACVEIRAGRALDVSEIDGATYRKIDDARAIIENLSYRPARDRFKIYIIDEAHQLTDSGLQRAAEDARGAAAARQVYPRDDRAAEDARDDPVAAAALRFPAHPVRRYFRAAARSSPGAKGVEVEESRYCCSRARPAAACAMRSGCSRRRSRALGGQGDRGRGRVDARRREPQRRLCIVRRDLSKDAASCACARCASCDSRGANLESLGRDLLEALRNLAVAKLPADDSMSPLADLPDHEAAELKRLAERASNRDVMRLFRLMAEAQEEITEIAVSRPADGDGGRADGALAPVMDADELLRAIGNGGGRTRVLEVSSGPHRRAAALDQPRWCEAGAARRVTQSSRSRGVPAPVEGEVKADCAARSEPHAATMTRELARAARFHPRQARGARRLHGAGRGDSRSTATC